MSGIEEAKFSIKITSADGEDFIFHVEREFTQEEKEILESMTGDQLRSEFDAMGFTAHATQ